jgi:diguanylate cyclase (GGDEF)-like protein
LLLAAVAASLVSLALLAWQTIHTTQSAQRWMGTVLEPGDRGLVITFVGPGSPAAVAGLEAGDEVLAVGEVPTRAMLDVAEAASRFPATGTVPVTLLRDGRRHILALDPGVEVSWSQFAGNTVIILAYLALGLLALGHCGADRRARVLAAFAFAVTYELTLPISPATGPAAYLVGNTAFYLLTGFQIGAELHLASVIPARRRWLDRRGVVPLYYLAGLVPTTLTAAAFLAEECEMRPLSPWSWEQLNGVLSFGLQPAWAVAVPLLLLFPALRYPEPRGRQQAGLVLLGTLPWSAVNVTVVVLALLGRPEPLWLPAVESWSLLFFPLAIVAAIFRHHLFDLELVVRQGLVHTGLATLLLLGLYLLLGGSSLLLPADVRADLSVWLVSAATLVLGLLFRPLRKVVQRFVDQRFFPEREGQKRSLVALAEELPALGKLARMGKHLVAGSQRIFGVQSVALLLSDPGSGRLSTLAAVPDPPAEIGSGSAVRLEEAGQRGLVNHPRPVPAASFLEHHPGLRHRPELAGAAYLVPLVHQAKLVGLLVLGPRSSDGRFPAEELELAALLAEHVAPVLENARLFESATVESLTGLLRREAILEQAERELERALRYQRPLTVGLADLDFFKEVNDQHGHLVGDSLLRRIGKALAAELRATDQMGRYGGEEFLLVLPETDGDGGWVVAEKLRHRVEKTALVLDDGTRTQVTISVGLATVCPGPQSDRSVRVMDLIAAADRALYRAKRSGRNQVQPAPPRRVVGSRSHE